MNASLRFAGYEVHPVRHCGDYAEVCPPSDADFFSLYGLLPRADGRFDMVCIGDFNSEEAAQTAMELISPS